MIPNLSCDPTISILAIYLREKKSVSMHTSKKMLTEALFAIGKSW